MRLPARTRPRTIVRLLLCLAVGLGISTAAAWGLGWRPQGSSVCGSFGLQSGGGPCAITWRGDFGRDAIEVSRLAPNSSQSMARIREDFAATFGPDSSPALWPDGSNQATWLRRLFRARSSWTFSAQTKFEVRTVIAIGWPMRSFQGYESWMMNAPGAKASRAILWRDPATALRAVAVHPLPLGLAVNAAVCAVPVLAIAIAWPGVRSTLRRRRGRCPMCAYDLRSDFGAGCPECGWNRASIAHLP